MISGESYAAALDEGKSHAIIWAAGDAFALVTTVLDAGSAGAHTFPGFRKHVINTAETRVFALLNISVVGLTTSSKGQVHGELLELRYVNPQLAVRTIEQNRDAILGIKIRLSKEITDE